MLFIPNGNPHKQVRSWLTRPTAGRWCGWRWQIPIWSADDREIRAGCIRRIPSPNCGKENPSDEHVYIIGGDTLPERQPGGTKSCSSCAGSPFTLEGSAKRIYKPSREAP